MDGKYKASIYHEFSEYPTYLLLSLDKVNMRNIIGIIKFCMGFHNNDEFAISHSWSSCYADWYCVCQSNDIENIRYEKSDF